MTENKSLVPVEAPATELDKTLGVDGLDRSDFRLPFLRIVQPQSRNAPQGSEGHFLNSVSQVAKEYILGVVLRVTKTRILWPETFSADSEPLCASDDGISPRAAFVNTGIQDWAQSIGPVVIPDTCAKCPLQQWSNQVDKPPCALSYKYILVDLEDGMPGLLTLSRTAVGMAKGLNTLLAVPGFKKLRMSTDLVESDKGKWHGFRYSVAGQPSDEDWQLIRLVAPMVRDIDVTAELGDEDKSPRSEASPPPEDDDIPF